MKPLAFGCSLLLLLAATAAAEPLLRPNDRVAICGGGYSIYLEDYLLACQPIPGLDVAQFEWSAEIQRVCSRGSTPICFPSSRLSS